MKRQLKQLLSRISHAAVLVAAVAFAGSAVHGAEKLGGSRLEGTWDVRVTLRNCQSGAEIRSFDSLGIFMSGGTMIDSTSGIPQALKTPGKGIWSHIRGNTYRFKFKVFLFDADGNYAGYQVIDHEAWLDQSADSYESAGTAEFYAPNGFLFMTGCSTTTATRFLFD